MSLQTIETGETLINSFLIQGDSFDPYQLEMGHVTEKIITPIK